MANEQKRTFEDHDAVRGQTPAMLGIVGPSRSGKTYSALRLAHGLQRVTGGDIFMLDSESNRGLHYAGKFKFRHVPFKAPFSPPDYTAAIKHCVSKGAKTIIIDSMSHEHEGPGGVLEMHAAEVERLGGGERNNFPAWNKPKSARRAMINFILQQPCNFIFCFRAKEKTKPSGGKLVELGWTAIAGEEFLYEMLQNFLLLPGAKGVPTWQSQFPNERELMQQAEQFAPLYKTNVQLSEDVGEYIARWCAGGEPCAPFPPVRGTSATADALPASAKPAASSATKPADALKFHPKFTGYGGQVVANATADVRNEYDAWLVEMETEASGEQQAKISKHLEEVRELNIRLAAESAMAAENAAE
jgi:hypothetical protein